MRDLLRSGLAVAASLQFATALEWTLEVDPTTVRAEVNAKVFGLTTYGQQPDASLFSQPAVSQIGTTTITWDFWLPKTSIPVNL
jgi:hypothetical protein